MNCLQSFLSGGEMSASRNDARGCGFETLRTDKCVARLYQAPAHVCACAARIIK